MRLAYGGLAIMLAVLAGCGARCSESQANGARAVRAGGSKAFMTPMAFL